MKLLISIILSFSSLCFSADHPFNYDLHLSSIPGSNARTMICLHGYGSSHKIAEKLKSLELIESTLISFNFPDHDIKQREYDFKKSTYGTIHELLPAFYVLKKSIIDEKRESIDLCGYSAGGGAVVNILAILNSNAYKSELKKLGIGSKERKIILDAIQKGIVVLEVPLKSCEEIIALRERTPELEHIAKNYRKNKLRPLDAIAGLKGLSLDLIIYFQDPDEIIYNRDDALYIEKIKKINSGQTATLIGNEGTHGSPHPALWGFYSQKINKLIDALNKIAPK